MDTPLTPEQLRHSCDLSAFGISSTADITPDYSALGQTRAMDAIQFAIGMEPKAMTMHEQVKLLCEVMRKNEELMAALRVESLNWWDEQHGAEEKKSKRKSVLKDENCGYYMEPSDVPKCPPLDGTGYKPCDPEAWMADIETTATNTEPI